LTCGAWIGLDGLLGITNVNGSLGRSAGSSEAATATRRPALDPDGRRLDGNLRARGAAAAPALAETTAASSLAA